MPKELHDKVNELLKNDSFYPEKSKKEREDLAWPIATNILKESSFNFKNYKIAQVAGQELFKSETIDQFVEKFGLFANSNPNKLLAFNEYLKSALYKGKKLSGYQGFRLFANFLNQNSNRNLTNDEMKISLNTIDKTDANNFVFNEELTKETEPAKSDAPVSDLAKQRQPGDLDTSLIPGPEKATGNYGTPGIQGITQFTSQSAANAPKTKEQIDASERMFMMDNMNALKILSRNIFDNVALMNFQKDLTLSKNHIGTRFQGPVNNLLGKFGELVSTPDSDRKTKNKLGAEIQYIIQNQLLGSGVRPSVIDLRSPNSRTDYLFSGSKPPTPYQFRYVEDVYFDMKNELTTKFNEDRKAFAEEYIKKLKERYPDAQETPETLGEAVYPDELKLVAKPGSPIHQRAWMESNQKSVLQKAFGAEQADGNTPSNSSDANPKGTMTFNSSTRNPGSQLNAPEAPDPRNIDKSNLSGMLGRPQITNPNPTKPSAFNYKDLKSTPAPPTSEVKANRINKFNLFKHS